uniref:Uncharacterized protein n=1 Tax=Anguilla anguilla TaxID=7936 RepID=A0A0E9QQ58_ANGAN
MNNCSGSTFRFPVSYTVSLHRR